MAWKALRLASAGCQVKLRLRNCTKVFVSRLEKLEIVELVEGKMKNFRSEHRKLRQFAVKQLEEHHLVWN
jgi:hypothetical protein